MSEAASSGDSSPSSNRLIKVDSSLSQNATLFALAATARHAIAGFSSSLPDLIVGHGVLGRLLARLTIAAGGRPPTVWEVSDDRMGGSQGYHVIKPDQDEKSNYGTIFEASGDPSLVNTLIGRIQKGGEIVLTGFYPKDINFAFPQAFMKEMRMRVAAEFNADDIRATRSLIDSGSLSLEGLISHVEMVRNARKAYDKAFNDNGCLKMILNWGEIQ